VHGQGPGCAYIAHVFLPLCGQGTAVPPAPTPHMTYAADSIPENGDSCAAELGLDVDAVRTCVFGQVCAGRYARFCSWCSRVCCSSAVLLGSRLLSFADWRPKAGKDLMADDAKAVTNFEASWSPTVYLNGEQFCLWDSTPCGADDADGFIAAICALYDGDKPPACL
jgi:hypothetical protein